MVLHTPQITNSHLIRWLVNEVLEKTGRNAVVAYFMAWHQHLRWYLSYKYPESGQRFTGGPAKEKGGVAFSRPERSAWPHDKFWQSFTIIHPARLYSSDVRNWIKGPTNTRTHTHKQRFTLFLKWDSVPHLILTYPSACPDITVASPIHWMLTGLHTDRRADIYKEMKFKSKFDKL